MRCQRGAAAVEVAIIFPLLLAFVIAIAEYGIYFLTSYETEQVAAQAARAGAVAPEASRETEAAAEANRLITALGLAGYNPTVTPAVITAPSGKTYTQVNVNLSYNTVTGVSSLPGIGLFFPSKIDRTSAYQNLNNF
ncbi:MAG: pilus assembly protein [Nitrospirales bacterium]|nr:pilus assembly protein [Nitrospirales bacterium]